MSGFVTDVVTLAKVAANVADVAARLQQEVTTAILEGRMSGGAQFRVAMQVKTLRETLRLFEQPKVGAHDHLFEVAFSVKSSEADPERVDVAAMLDALQARVDDLRSVSGDEAFEAFGHVETVSEEAVL